MRVPGSSRSVSRTGSGDLRGPHSTRPSVFCRYVMNSIGVEFRGAGADGFRVHLGHQHDALLTALDRGQAA